MQDVHREIIQRNIIALSKEVNLDNLYPLLIEECLIQEDDIREFKTKFQDREAQAEDFFLWYRTRGPKAFDALIKSLRALELESLATLLEAGSENLGGSGPSSSGFKKDDDPLEFHDIRSALPEVEATNSRKVSFEYLDIHVEKATDYNMGVCENVYPMQSQPRGYALIINNICFPNEQFSYRRGAEVDTNNLERLWQKLGFDVILGHNLGRKEFFKQIENFRRKFSEKSVDACIVAIMSHGDENLIEMCDADSSPVRLWEDVVERFNHVECPGLMGKPKMFFVQTCRGKKHDKGVLRKETDCGNLTNGMQENPSNTNSPELQIPPNANKSSSYGDILVCHATIPGYVANRDVKKGTWFMRTLCEVFMENAHNTEFKKLLDMVGIKLAKLNTDGTFQTPSYTSYGFNFALYFNPELYENNSHLPAPRKRNQEAASSSSSSSQLP